MAVIPRDKDVVREGRENKLKGVAVSLQEQIPAKLLKKVKELKLAERIVEMWNTGNIERSDWLARQQEYLADWDEFLECTDDGPWEGSSNLHLPMTLIVVKTLHARFLQALLGQDPPFVAKANNDASSARQPMVQQTMEYALKTWMNKGEGCYQALDEWVMTWLTEGSGILKGGWETCYSRYEGVEQYMEQKAPIFEVDQEGNEIAIPQYEVKERETTITRETYNCPTIGLVDNEDFLCVGGHDPKTSDAAIQSEMLTASDLWTLVDREVFDEEGVEKVIKSGGDSNTHSEVGNIKDQRAVNAGQNSSDSSVDLERYQILEAYIKADVDGSGINSDIVVWVHPKTREPLRATYLYRINKAGERPFAKASFHRRRNQQHDVGIVEMMHPLQKELDAQHRMKLDFGMLASMPFGFYRPTSSINPQQIELSPGALIPVDNPGTDVYFPNLGNRTAFGFQEEASILAMIERLTSVSDVTLGIVSGVQGASRTATGVRSLIGESSANLDVHLRRLNMGWRQALRFLFHSLQQKIPAGLSFRVTGDDGSDYWASVKSRNDIAGDFDFEISPNSSSSNPQLQIENARVLLDLTSNPLDIQLGIVSPRGRYEALRNYVSALNIRDVGRFFNKPQEQRIFTPQEEVNRILRGIPTPVTAQADHQGFIEYFQFIQSSDELLGQYTQQEVLALAQQAQQHAEWQQVLEELATQQRNLGQMRQNSVQGANQAALRLPPGQ